MSRAYVPESDFPITVEHLEALSWLNDTFYGRAAINNYSEVVLYGAVGRYEVTYNVRDHQIGLHRVDKSCYITLDADDDPTDLSLIWAKIREAESDCKFS